MIKLIKNYYHKLREQYIVDKYIKYGAELGDANSYSFLGECIGYNKLEKKFAKYEKLYTGLGYKVIDIVDFMKYGGYGDPIDHLIRVKND